MYISGPWQYISASRVIINKARQRVPILALSEPYGRNSTMRLHSLAARVLSAFLALGATIAASPAGHAQDATPDLRAFYPFDDGANPTEETTNKLNGEQRDFVRSCGASKLTRPRFFACITPDGR